MEFPLARKNGPNLVRTLRLRASQLGPQIIKSGEDHANFPTARLLTLVDAL